MKYMMVDTLCPSWHELPKSTILMALLLGLQRRMFSGFRSQWMMLSSGVARKSSAVHSCWANFRVRLSETPRKLVFRSRSYKLYDSISNTRQRWLRNMKWRFRWTAKKQKLDALVTDTANRWICSVCGTSKVNYQYSISSPYHVCS